MNKFTLVTQNNIQIIGQFNKVKDSKKLVLFVHGMTGNSKTELTFLEIEKILSAHNVSTIKFDFRGHGASEGIPETDFTITNSLTDLEAIDSYIKSIGFTELSIVANSLGAGIVVLYLMKSRLQIKSLFLTNPVLDFTNSFVHPHTSWMKANFSNATEQLKEKGYIEVGFNKYRIGHEMYQELCKFNPAQYLSQLKIPTMIVQGSVDVVVSLQDIITLIKNVHNPALQLIQVPGGTHGLYGESESKIAVEECRKFLSFTLGDH